jgi:double-stranded uracil-DNA glycosylase
VSFSAGSTPGFRSAAAAAHFADPRNDFWRLLADADLTPRLLVPEEQWEMLDLGFGRTNAAYRTT